ncbi:hypothetical protein SCALIN_C45_0057 [Candidatus Scalindua japonica]|uniref:Uncharacterized protein n=1 Tax=Candidatus Scalindua japonica TaxID=1284222 RepID=A0A286U434_9BACT|nr:tetratricopeptide repeat protein [Candidatus Scalindua japonica]GAX62899.1 hypothetical protein SCALIN_C45_0057 [Candidatus Scalindua japonica]
MTYKTYRQVSGHLKSFSLIKTIRNSFLVLITIVSVISFFIAFCAVLGYAGNNNIRVINVKVVADEEFRASDEWVDVIVESFKRTSAFYEEQFGIKFNLKLIGEWISDNNSFNIQSLLEELSNNVGKDGSELVVGFTRQVSKSLKCVFSRPALGIALPFNDYVIVRADRKKGFDYHIMSLILTHELGHAFGALHVRDSTSVMNISVNNHTVFRFDDRNSKLIRLTKFVDFNKGVTSLKKSCLEQIIGLYRDGFEVDYENATRHLLIGSIFSEQGMIDEAILEYKEAVKIDRKDPESLTRLGVAYAGKGLLDDAIKVLSKAVRLDSINGAAHVNLGMVLVRKGKQEEAIDHLRKAIEINSINPEAHCILGGIYIQKGLFDKAIFECKKALDYNHIYSDAYYNLGIAYHSKLMYDEAITAYKKAIEIEYKNTMARNNLGLAYYEQGMLEEAESEYIKLLRVDPGNQMALNNYQAVLFAKKEGL